MRALLHAFIYTLKAPAVLIKGREGASYAETVRAIKNVVNPAVLGVNISKMRMTREGHLLLEVKDGDDSVKKAEVLKEAVVNLASDHVSAVAQLGGRAEVEILDLDPAVDEKDVRTALQGAILNRSEDPSAASSVASVEITGLWPTKAGYQIATAKMSAAAMAKLIDAGKVAIGWTMARVRRCPPAPLRCQRCHGFGHSTFKCTGPDLTGNCRKCGSAGHLEKSCTEVNKCIVCDRLGRIERALVAAWRDAPS